MFCPFFFFRTYEPFIFREYRLFAGNIPIFSVFFVSNFPTADIANGNIRMI